MTKQRKDKTERPRKEKSLVLQYTNLLHKHGSPEDRAVRLFREKHRDDEVFQKRANVLDRAFKMRTLADC
jgi:hypothetical protein